MMKKYNQWVLLVSPQYVCVLFHEKMQTYMHKLLREAVTETCFLFTMIEYHEADCWEGSSSESSVEGSWLGTPTPRNSPKPTTMDPQHPVDDDDLPPSTTSTLRGPLDLRDTLDHSLPPSARSTLTRPEIAHVMNTLKRQDTFSRWV